MRSSIFRGAVGAWLLTMMVVTSGCTTSEAPPDDVSSEPGAPLNVAPTEEPPMEAGHAALVNQPAPELLTDAFVQGESATLESLRGKVVLLDFWAVWCGPCVASFPHLREWYDKYHDDGLEIIGLTNYYQYDFDDGAGQIVESEGLSPQAEQDALRRFAKHHQLAHRLAVMPNEVPQGRTATSQQYGVEGIPQMVLIDRAGKVRLVLVGNSPENAAALEAKIDVLLGESPAEEKSSSAGG